MTEFLPTDKPGVVTVESRRSPGTFYTVTGFGTPFAVCNCPGYVNRGHCWHAETASEEGATVMGELPTTILDLLNEPIDPKRVATFTQGPQQGTPYLEHHDVVRTANRIFGYGKWGFRTLGLPVMIEAGEQGQNKTAYEVWAVVGELTVQGCPPFNDVGTNVRQGKGSAGLEMAFKGAASDALKRCLRHYGDQFGLVLYDKEIGRQDLAAKFQQAHGDAAVPEASGLRNRMAPSDNPLDPAREQMAPSQEWNRLGQLIQRFPGAKRERVAEKLGGFSLQVLTSWLEEHPGRNADLLVYELTEPIAV